MKELNIRPELRDEYNRKYEIAFDLLRKYAFIQHSHTKQPNFLARKHIKEAVSLLQRCLEIWRDSWAAMWGIGKAHQALGNHLAALGWFERAMRIEESNPDIYREATIEALSLGEEEKALTYAKKALELKPDDDGLQANLALALLLNRKGEEALNEINEACTRNPKDNVSKNVLEFISDVVTGKKPYPERI
jgi:tetratricopeptide (TPR) repeat protein